MSYTNEEYLLVIGAIGLITVFIRSLFLFYLPKSADQPLIKRGMQAVPAAMLVALVIPFTFFVDQQIVLLRREVYAILLALPVMRLTKRYPYGLVFAVLIYLVLSFFQI